MKVLGGKSQPELQNLKQYIKVGLTTQHPKYWSLFYKLSKSPCMNIFCHDFFAHALYQTHHGPGKAKPVFAEYTTFAKKGPPNLVWCHVLPCPGISCTNVPNRVFFYQDSHIVQLFFKHTQHKSSIVEEIRRRDGERSFFLFDPGVYCQWRFLVSGGNWILNQAYLLLLWLLLSIMNSLGEAFKFQPMI